MYVLISAHCTRTHIRSISSRCTPLGCQVARLDRLRHRALQRVVFKNLPASCRLMLTRMSLLSQIMLSALKQAFRKIRNRIMHVAREDDIWTLIRDPLAYRRETA